MPELVAALALVALLILAYFLIADSDDDNSGGGLMEPSLIPIPVRRHEL